jgi:hypothetical protein
LVVVANIPSGPSIEKQVEDWSGAGFRANSR